MMTKQIEKQPLSEKLEALTFLVDPENQPHQGYSLEKWRSLIADIRLLEAKVNAPTP